MSTRQRSPSPSPTVTLDVPKHRNLQRSSSEESVRVIHHAVLFPTSPNPGRVSYIRTTYETDAELIRRQQAAIALQPLTFAEELATKRKHLAARAEKRKLEKVAAVEAKEKAKMQVPEITVVPSSGNTSPLPPAPSPTRQKVRTIQKDKTKSPSKPVVLPNNAHGARQRIKQFPLQQDRQITWKKRGNEIDMNTSVSPIGVFGKMDK